jgi:PAS domain S-box-containing protein
MKRELHVLIVEDSASDTSLLLHELRRGGYEPIHERVETAEAMKAALAKPTWDLVIADYALPQFDAPTALALLKDTGQDVAFIVVSGRIGEDLAVAMMKAGAHDYVMKNNLTRLVPAVERELCEAVVRREGRQAAEALRESEQLFRSLVEGVKDYAIFMLDPDGCVASWNPGAERIQGYQAKEIIGQPFACLYLTEDVERGKPEYDLMGAAAEGRFEDEGWRRCKDGSQFWASVVVTPLFEVSGNLRGFVHVTRDLTDRKRADEERERLLRELMKTNRDLAALAQITDAALSGAKLEELLEGLLPRLAQVLNADTALISLKENDHWRVRASGGTPEQMPTGFVEKIIATTKPLYLEDAQAGLAGEGQAAGPRRLRTGLGVPVKWDGVPVGVLSLGWSALHQENHFETHILEIAAERFASAIHHAQWQAQTQEAPANLQTANQRP